MKSCLKLSPEGDCSKHRYGPIGEWDVSRITDMASVFSGAKLFTGDVSKWDVSDVDDMTGMFEGAASFDSDISKWDVSSVEDMNQMFFNAAAFNGDILGWDVSSVTDMSEMFCNAAAFNCDISQWRVGKVRNMDKMFLNAQSFDVQLCGPAWVYSPASKELMFEGSPGEISKVVCEILPERAYRHITRRSVPEYVSRRPQPDRELIVRTPISASVRTSTSTSMTTNATTCSKCGTFLKSGRASCCAPGGAWYKTCGGVGNSEADRSWSEGVEICQRKFKVDGV